MKLSTVFARAADVVMDPTVPNNAYFHAIRLAVGDYCHSQGAAEEFAEPYAMSGTPHVPQQLSREERALLFGFLAELAKQAGK